MVTMLANDILAGWKEKTGDRILPYKVKIE